MGCGDAKDGQCGDEEDELSKRGRGVGEVVAKSQV